MEALRLDIILNSTEAEAALARYANALVAAGDKATDAAAKAEKLEKQWAQNRARVQAKKELDDLADATTRAGTASEKTAGKQSAQVTATDALVGAVKRYAAPAAIGMAILKTIEWADNINDMAERTKLSVTQVQQLEKMAAKNGSSFGQMASLIQVAEQRLASHNQKAEDAVKILGLVPEKLLAMDPLERLRAIAKGLADIENPAKRSKLEVDLLGRSSDEASVALNALARGLDKAELSLSQDFVEAGAKASDALDDIKNRAMDVLRTIVLVGPAILAQAQKLDEANKARMATGTIGPPGAGAWAQSGMGPFAGLIGSRIDQELGVPGLPNAPVNPFAAGPSVPGLPGGDFRSFVNGWGLSAQQRQQLFGGGGGVTPYTANQWATISQILGPQNPLGNGGLGSFPGWAAGPLASSMSPSLLGIGFDRGSQMVGFAPTVAMNAPGAGGGGLSGFLQGRGGAMAGAGLSFLTNMFGSRLGLSQTGSSIGSLVGSFIPGLGPLGGALGGVAGGLIGKLFGGNQDKKQLAQLRSGDEFNDLIAKAKEFGIATDAVFNAKKVTDFQKAMKDLTNQISEQEASSNRVKDAMERWGFTIEDMGPKFKQQEMNKTALEITKDFESLLAAGADVNKIIEKMGPSVGKFVHSSIEMGTKVPKEMEPIIKKMIEQGTLLDKNGEKFTDISQIPFAEGMTEGFDRVAQSINRLIDRIDALTRGIYGATDAATDLGDATSGIDTGSGGGSETYVSRGGVVAGKGRVLYFGRGGFVPRGTDSVPAMLTPGEMVIARDQVRALARGRSAGNVSVTINVAGYLDSPKVQRQLAQVVTDQIDRDVRMRRVG